MQVSVIIPALNEAAGIAAAIERAWLAGASEVIVVDGGSHDQTVEICRQSDCQLVESPSGRATQQNAGVVVASGRVLLFLHADNHLAADSVAQIRTAVEAGHAHGAFHQQIEARGLLYRALEWGNACRVNWWGLAYGDQAIFLTRELFDSLGGFPEVRLMEDLLLMRAARRVSRPVLLAGPLYVNARRWQRHGVIRQTARNWWLLIRERCGVSPDRLAADYRRHDQ